MEDIDIGRNNVIRLAYEGLECHLSEVCILCSNRVWRTCPAFGAGREYVSGLAFVVVILHQENPQ
ncbi:hypothetical protein F441_01853 [Phytophthora nicotianae CJ01A1]|uniref:Uncharacterized protein n=3 Tax=Phytophthora nicotianae TaxID=4792 RepID=W2JQI1_PHYNI|nr:hypothetical protein L915_01817 [Phytophthora nicotianae]ETL48631.1 hypothetical protein L916_01780 [Phytophthora nicotianae]ETO84163.1 hypothetical protein F444_01895 [Phytophthora nicotianae P1976]ETP25243.1 hypothetical protein F441_01853 [Phytophthora nicotianae CJ01A1]